MVIMPTKTTERGRSWKDIYDELNWCANSDLLHDVDIQVKLWEGDPAREVPGDLSEDIAGEDSDEALVPGHKQWGILQAAAQ